MLCSFSKKNQVGRRRRNSFFVGGVSKSKMITLQINGLSDDVSLAYRSAIINVRLTCICMINRTRVICGLVAKNFQIGGLVPALVLFPLMQPMHLG